MSDTDLATATRSATGELNRAEQASLIIQAMQCTTEPEYQHVSAALKACKGEIKRLETKRKTFTGPLLQTKRLIDAEFKMPITILEACEKQLKIKVVDYHAAIEVQQHVAMVSLQAAHAQGNFAQAIQLSQSVPEVPKVDGVSVSHVWKYRLVDAMAVPREYLAVNDKAVRAAIRDGHREIPGLEIYQESQVRAASK